MLELWRQCDDWGYDSLWNFDHFYPILSDPEGPCLESWTTLAALAQVTKRARIGALVNGNTYRHPSLTAKMAMTVDHISGGRLNLGIGAGWFEEEHRSLGFEFATVGGRLRALEESLQIITGMLAGERVTLDGKYYRVADARCVPAPLQKKVPIMIGGEGRKVLLRLVAQYADMWNAFGTPAHMKELIDVLGRHCDAVGRDILSRLIHGARFSLFIGVVVVAIALTGGILIGLISGYFRGWIDTIIMRIMDIVLAFPSLLLALVLVAILGPGLINAMIAIAIVYQPHFARLTRASVMSELNREYVTSAKVAGARHLRLMFVTILPNCLAPLIVQATLGFSTAILDAAALGFLGMGAQPPTPEWGTMLAEAREFILRAWWVVTLPGLAILVTVLAVNLVGDGLRDALDPKLKRS